jgi:UDP-glucose 4-epimerase
MKHCCVIGGGGFIGGHVVEKLILRQRRVTIIDTNPTPSRPVPDGVNYVIGDYGEKSFLKRALHDVDEIIHLAYSTVPKTSFEDPLGDISENLPATVTLLEAACSIGVDKFILMSSGGTVYGKVDKVPIPEDHPTNPISPYGITKLATEKYAIMYGELKGLAVIRIRPGNAYGEGQKPFVGQGFISTAIASILKAREVTIFGEAGTIRDYIHVSDIADGIIAVLEHGKVNSCYNIGSGIGRSNKDVLAAIAPLAESEGLEVRVKTLPQRPFDVPANVLDSTRLTNETGWKPGFSFEDGIKRTWDWFYENYAGDNK